MKFSKILQIVDKWYLYCGKVNEFSDTAYTKYKLESSCGSFWSLCPIYRFEVLGFEGVCGILGLRSRKAWSGVKK
jgi:hypothetical protein